MNQPFASLGNIAKAMSNTPQAAAFGNDEAWKRQIDIGYRRGGMKIATELPLDLKAALKTLDYAREAVIQMLAEKPVREAQTEEA